MTDTDDEDFYEPTVEEQVALMYLGAVDEGAAQIIAQRIVAALMPEEEGAKPPRNADVFYALLTAQTSLMTRMAGTVDFRATILRGFGAIAAGQLELRMRPPKPKQKKPKKPAAEPRKEPEEPPEERGPPRPYTERVTGDLDVYTVQEFQNAASTLNDKDGYAYQVVKLGSGLLYYAPDKKYQVKPSDFAGPDGPSMLPGTSHIAWMTR